jgi:hypothetical protein
MDRLEIAKMNDLLDKLAAICSMAILCDADRDWALACIKKLRVALTVTSRAKSSCTTETKEMPPEKFLVEINRDTIKKNIDNNYSFEYADVMVKCCVCKETFSYRDQISDPIHFCLNKDDKTAVLICPKCGKPSCCVLEFENITIWR